MTKAKTRTWLVVGLLAAIGLPFALTASGCGPSASPPSSPPPPPPPTTRGGPSSMDTPAHPADAGVR
jgi:hypothetical protein